MKKDCSQLTVRNLRFAARSLIFYSLSLLLATCQNSGKKEEVQEIEEPKKQEVKSDFVGNYVTEEYFKRQEGYDWVAVTIREDGENNINVSVRSRADRKKPTCTLDATAYKLDDSTYHAYFDGKEVLFQHRNNKLEIKTKDPQDESVLAFYCSGGATLAGSYKKLDGQLDQSQIDKTLFSQTLSLQGIGFNISSVQEDSKNLLTVAPFGLELVNRPETVQIDGRVIGAEIEDLNSDGSPEILVYTQSDGSGSYGNVYGYSVNNRKSMSQIYLPPISENEEINQGYMGHDEFAIVETSLVRRFPIYKENDTNANPTGGMRQVQYVLREGEALRQFVVKNVTEY